jgi:alpha-amylase
MVGVPNGLKTLTALALCSLLVGCVQTEAEVLPEAIPERYEDQVGIQMFMYSWESIAKECEFLGANGIDWVLTSPPQEHITGDPWWTVYQPVSYQIEGRLGNRDQFAEMVQTCESHDVEIIVDAVINHMSGQAFGTGSAGSEFSKYEYPGLYTRADFHDCQLTDNGQIQDYRDMAQVQTCELLGLSDLDTSAIGVQQTLVNYLNDLLSLGVAGFRIDAAKHINSEEVAQIVSQLPQGTRVILEVIRGTGEPIQPEQYLGSGDVWEFDYARNLRGFFNGEIESPLSSEIRQLSFVASNQALAFVSNHDTERNGETLSYYDSRRFELATALMLAKDFGQPILYSGYAFSDNDQGPSEANGQVSEVNCETTKGPKSEYLDGEWVCQHRWQSTLNMLRFKSVVADAPITEQFQDIGVYGFAREGRGYFITNIFESEGASVRVQTTLPDGDYVDLIGGATHQIIDGILEANLDPVSAIALMVTP